MPDFSSSSYWSTRFETEAPQGGFEWLSSSSKVIPTVLRIFDAWLVAPPFAKTAPCHTASITSDPLSNDVKEGDDCPPTRQEDGEEKDRTFRVLHFGCGTSTLGNDIHQALHTHLSALPGISKPPRIQITDSDYVLPSLLSSSSSSSSSPSPTSSKPIQMDMLNLTSVQSNSPSEWDLIIDKSTADAISCGPSVHHKDELVEPIIKLVHNLREVSKRGTIWICISYSANRFPFLPLAVREGRGPDRIGEVNFGWEVKEKFILETKHLPSGRIVRDHHGERTVYEPETGIWCYILHRV